MIKTRFWFQLHTNGRSVELAKEVFMPFLVEKDQLFKIALDDDGEIQLYVEHPPTFDISRMSLSVGLGRWKEDSAADWEESQAACLRAGWRTFEEEYKELHPEE